MKFYNSLSRKKEEFVPVNKDLVRIYSCGPTVYDYQHIGNLRTATLMDVIKRSLKYFGYNVLTVMNVTDIEDKIENRARDLKLKVDEITTKYEAIYMDNLSALNIFADFYPHASGHIKEQIEIIQELEKKGYVYLTALGLYFDTSKDIDYGKLGNTYKSDKASSRIDDKEGKRNPEDFVLWRLPKENEERQKVWDSPWGVGYPGWHIECTAMSLKTLTKAFSSGRFDSSQFETIDIHLGGADLREVHHENEIAQSESATNKQFIKYWIHGGMLNTGDEKMSKSLGNFLVLDEVIKRGYDPLALRYFYFTAHYRKELNFTWEALDSAQNGLNRLRKEVSKLGFSENRQSKAVDNEYKKFFEKALVDDLNMPEALAALWGLLGDEKISLSDKATLVISFDEVLGLKLVQEDVEGSNKPLSIDQLPKDVQQLIKDREEFRKQKNWQEADDVRNKISGFGYDIKDTSDGVVVTPRF